MSDITTKKASDGGHWYTSKGELVETVPGSKGTPIKPDIRHARKFDLAPGVTTIIKAADRPTLNMYREKQVLLASLTLTRQEGETDEQWIDRIMADSREHARNAADRGSELHGQVERGLGDLYSDNPWVFAVAEQLEQVAPNSRTLWRCERPCVGEYGYATKSDLSLDTPTHAVVVDIKSKDGPLEELRLWDEHSQQLAATREALGLRTAQCAILFLSRTEPQARLVLATEDQIQHGWACFKALLHYWQIKHRHKPSWSKQIFA